MYGVICEGRLNMVRIQFASYLLLAAGTRNTGIRFAPMEVFACAICSAKQSVLARRQCSLTICSTRRTGDTGAMKMRTEWQSQLVKGTTGVRTGR